MSRKFDAVQHLFFSSFRISNLSSEKPQTSIFFQIVQVYRVKHVLYSSLYTNIILTIIFIFYYIIYSLDIKPYNFIVLGFIQKKYSNEKLES